MAQPPGNAGVTVAHKDSQNVSGNKMGGALAIGTDRTGAAERAARAQAGAAIIAAHAAATAPARANPRCAWEECMIPYDASARLQHSCAVCRRPLHGMCGIQRGTAGGGFPVQWCSEKCQYTT